ncbi:MAG: GDSL-type esterase/lipase family protein [Candidatus Choladocola sp.]|nr:GDSL-type esterase/lipase family protein [Candidatus Choladocola sp.]
MKRILCYGDSNTHGCNPAWVAEWEDDLSKGVRFSKEERWTGILQEKLGGEYEIIEEGLPGRTTVFADPVYPYFDGRATVLPVILSQSPIDLVVLMLGTNDLKVTFTPSEDVAARAMEELLKVLMNPYIWEHRKVPKILIVSPVSIRDNIADSHFWGMYDLESVRLSKELARIYEPLSKRYGCEFMDAAQYAEASLLDSIHMDAENHEKLAEALCQKIKEILV